MVRNGDQISIRQPPGERNALGRIKFMFPNRHSVYLHDTPSRSLFAKTERAFSHGCVRVDQPFKLAEYVLNDKAIWPEKRIEKLIGGNERTISLSRRLSVHLAYFTLAADPDGSHRFRRHLRPRSTRGGWARFAQIRPSLCGNCGELGEARHVFVTIASYAQLIWRCSS